MNSKTDNKLCSRCGPWRGPQALECFDRDRRSIDNRRSVCKECRKEQRLEKLNKSEVGNSPNEPGAPTRNAKKSSPRTVSANDPPTANGHRDANRSWESVRRQFARVWLGVLFVGGFGWSTLNGSFALYDTAKSFLATSGYAIAVLAAGVLTLGSAVSASWSVKFIQRCENVSAMFLITIFVVIQSLNLIVNHAGVKARLTMNKTKNLQANQETTIEALQALKADYQRVIDRYPPTDKSGEPVIWKSQITDIVEMAHREIRKLNSEIKAKQLTSIEPAFKFDWRIVWAWLLLPELVMLTAILVFSMGFSRH